MGEPIVRESLVDQVRARIRDEMLAGRIVAGQLYGANGIATQLGVSRTPVREALLQMAEAGLVEFHPSRGFTVIPVSVDDVRATFQVRLALEVAAAARAATDGGDLTALRTHFTALTTAATDGDHLGLMVADRLFHDEILALAGNPRAAKAVRDARDSIFGRGVSVDSPKQSWSYLVEEHRQILEPIEAGDPAAAAEAMRLHLKSTAEELLAFHGDGTVPEGWDQAWGHLTR